MERPFCDVIGCGSIAKWHLISYGQLDPEEPLLEECLCDEHRQELARLHPDLACRYTPLTRDS